MPGTRRRVPVDGRAHRQQVRQHLAAARRRSAASAALMPGASADRGRPWRRPSRSRSEMWMCPRCTGCRRHFAMKVTMRPRRWESTLEKVLNSAAPSAASSAAIVGECGLQHAWSGLGVQTLELGGAAPRRVVEQLPVELRVHASCGSWSSRTSRRPSASDRGSAWRAPSPGLVEHEVLVLQPAEPRAHRRACALQHAAQQSRAGTPGARSSANSHRITAACRARTGYRGSSAGRIPHRHVRVSRCASR